MLASFQTASSELLEARDGQGATPLHVAAANGYLSVVEFLLDNHASTESVDNDRWQPIHAAACWGHLEVVEMLAQNGANIAAKTKNGETPFDICEDPEIKERLVQLREQRVRMGQPRVRRSHSASTRTQSIRRTSLREKMNTTKKDVQDEKLYFIQSFNAMPDASTAGVRLPSYECSSLSSSSSSAELQGPPLDRRRRGRLRGRLRRHGGRQPPRWQQVQAHRRRGRRRADAAAQLHGGRAAADPAAAEAAPVESRR